mmetsp:Transcript_27604/g.92334  ORF Transcript_27604/g.92334 Transcript_27604/m.92334 type:complete len:279 (-) Transcript_27604:448-1284(-)
MPPNTSMAPPHAMAEWPVRTAGGSPATFTSAQRRLARSRQWMARSKEFSMYLRPPKSMRRSPKGTRTWPTRADGEPPRVLTWAHTRACMLYSHVSLKLSRVVLPPKTYMRAPTRATECPDLAAGRGPAGACSSQREVATCRECTSLKHWPGALPPKMTTSASRCTTPECAQRPTGTSAGAPLLARSNTWGDTRDQTQASVSKSQASFRKFSPLRPPNMTRPVRPRTTTDTSVAESRGVGCSPLRYCTSSHRGSLHRSASSGCMIHMSPSSQLAVPRPP